MFSVANSEFGWSYFSGLNPRLNKYGLLVNWGSCDCGQWPLLSLQIPLSDLISSLHTKTTVSLKKAACANKIILALKEVSDYLRARVIWLIRWLKFQTWNIWKWFWNGKLKTKLEIKFIELKLSNINFRANLWGSRVCGGELGRLAEWLQKQALLHKSVEQI